MLIIISFLQKNFNKNWTIFHKQWAILILKINHLQTKKSFLNFLNNLRCSEFCHFLFHPWVWVWELAARNRQRLQLQLPFLFLLELCFWVLNLKDWRHWPNRSSHCIEKNILHNKQKGMRRLHMNKGNMSAFHLLILLLLVFFTALNSYFNCNVYI